MKTHNLITIPIVEELNARNAQIRNPTPEYLKSAEMLLEVLETPTSLFKCSTCGLIKESSANVLVTCPCCIKSMVRLE
jgi:hypothetical protein